MIELKRSELNQLYNFVDCLKLNKINNVQVRSLILKIILEGKKNSTIIQEDTDNIRNKFFSEFSTETLTDYQNHLNALSKLIRSNDTEKFNTCNKELQEKYSDIVAAHTNFTEALNQLRQEIVTINADKVSLDAFIDAMSNQNLDITGKDLEIFEPILNNDS